MPDPTPEQQAAVDAFATGGSLVLEARAGTGKTTTLKMLAGVDPGRRGVYLAYNRAIANDAKGSFPRWVRCGTAHSFAYAAVGRAYKDRLEAPRVPAAQTARILGITSRVELGEDLVLAPTAVARVVMETVDAFCRSADRQVGAQHVVLPGGFAGRPEAIDALRAEVLPRAERAWDDLVGTTGRLRFTHDLYLKLWQLTNPTLPCDYVMLDEAQDANPVIAAVVDAQTHAQRVMVGDACQAIYGWRGAVDALSRFPADHRLFLSQSFRFGPAVAAEANKWLELLDSQPYVVGTPSIESVVGGDFRPDAELCRTNAGAIVTVITALAAGAKVAIVGGGDEIRRFAEAARDLKDGLGTTHPELCAFPSWGAVVSYVAEDHAGRELKVFVDLVEDHGPEAILAACDSLVDEPSADLVVSTAHKAKGREWSAVRIAGDFFEPDDGELPAREEMMLGYVAVTRARAALDVGSLGWVGRVLARERVLRSAGRGTRADPPPRPPDPPVRAAPPVVGAGPPSRREPATAAGRALVSSDTVFVLPLVPLDR